jgi:hypothetical protein
MAAGSTGRCCEDRDETVGVGAEQVSGRGVGGKVSSLVTSILSSGMRILIYVKTHKSSRCQDRDSNSKLQEIVGKVGAMSRKLETERDEGE